MLPDVPQVEIAIVEMTNAFRRENKLAEVRTNPVLAKAARSYAEYLARTGTFSHTADGREPSERAQRAGYAFCQVAENLALNLDSRGFESRALAAQAVEGWKNSPGHRRNMLAPHVVEIGVAVAKAPDKDPKYISVQLFGRPKSLVYEFQIKNTAGVAVGYAFGGKSHTLEPRYSVTHTACLPDEIRFAPPKDLKRDPAVALTYAARNGDTYTLKRGPDGALAIDVTPAAATDAARAVRPASPPQR